MYDSLPDTYKVYTHMLYMYILILSGPYKQHIVYLCVCIIQKSSFVLLLHATMYGTASFISTQSVIVYLLVVKTKCAIPVGVARYCELLLLFISCIQLILLVFVQS